ncbi:MFS transporter [Nocardiopsis ansamitocini]|uniref:MFS transporter n=1 Tax=Nocardiopsis ansamitocini TaxID=1670832 RepID=A0A9W6P7L6_9ACTN|nr:MFS transporter [Nocardiopsis ansamitocini]GLU48537.1 MFS transporter [Nocardiopsis ansamitocini]
MALPFSPAPGSRHDGLRSRAFRLLLLATVASFSGYAMLLPLVPLWAVRGGAGEIGAGATTAVFMLTTVAMQLGMPWLLARGGYRWTFVTGSLLLGLPTALVGLSFDLVPLLVVAAVRGVGFGMVTVVGSALAARLVPPGQIGRAAGYYGMAVGAPLLVVLPAGVWLSLNVGFWVPFLAATLAPLLGAVAAAAIRLDVRGDADRAGRDGQRADGRTVLRLWGTLAAPLVAMLVLAVASSAVVTFLAIPLAAAPWVATAGLLGYSAAVLVGRWAAGLANDRGPGRSLLVAGALGASSGMILLAWALWPAGQGWSGPGAVAVTLVIVGAVLFGAGFGGVQNETMVLMFRRSGPAEYGTASAAWNIGFDAGTGVGALGLGVVAQTLGYGPAFAVAAVAATACLPVALSLARRTGRGGSAPSAADGGAY